MIRPVLLGPSGIGKTPLSKLFKLESWHPYRVRAPRNEEDAKTCLSPEEYQRRERLHAQDTPLYEGARRLRVYRERSLVEVRGTAQCLEHTPSIGDPSRAVLIELFAPVFVELLRNRERISPVVRLDPNDLLVLLLNPTSVSCAEIRDVPEALSAVIRCGILERSRLLGAGVDTADVERRVASVSEEVVAWREVIELVPGRVVECRAWRHSEYRYMDPNGACGAAAVDELTKARVTLLAEVAEQVPNALPEFKRIVRTPQEIQRLTHIV